MARKRQKKKHFRKKGRRRRSCTSGSSMELTFCLLLFLVASSQIFLLRTHGSDLQIQKLGHSIRAAVAVGHNISNNSSSSHNNMTAALDQLPALLDTRRYVFGIFSCNTLNERKLRDAIRQTFLAYYKLDVSVHPAERNTICSLEQLLSTPELAQNPRACLFVYTFVLAGGDLHTAPYACYWEECGTKTADFTIYPPQNGFSAIEEAEEHNDMTFLKVRENMNEGKVETWYTYMAALISLERPDLNIQFAGKMDSDAIMFVDRFWDPTKWERAILDRPYAIIGWPIPRNKCVRQNWANVCQHPQFKAPLFLLGGTYWMSSALLRHAYIDGLSLEQKKSLHIPDHEDMTQANMVFGGGNVTADQIAVVTMPKNTPASHDRFKSRSSLRRNYFKRCNCKYG